MPEFAAFAEERRHAQVLAVISGPEPEALEWSTHFGPPVLVVIEEEAALAQSLGIDAFPTMLALRDGTVEVNAGTPGPLRRLVQT
jgi:hypothetical protein